MRIDELDYDLPPELIAQRPAERRDAARLLVAHLDSPGAGAGAAVEHRHVYDLPRLLRRGDVLVINDTRVLPAKFPGVRETTGGKIEGLFVETRDDQTWLTLLRSGGRLRPGEFIALGHGARLELIEQQADGSWIARKHSELDTQALLDRVGSMPLPPYIEHQRPRNRAGEGDENIFNELDRERYQTVYAREAGAVAAPTAGLHFTPGMFEQLAAAGVEVASVTLHVGRGTFSPVRTETLEEHVMHTERFRVPAATLTALRQARAQGRRIIPVGTTSVRALESLPPPPELDPTCDFEGQTNLLIQPGFEFRWTDGLMTNFHLPRSTLLALVAARVGLERLMDLYRIAIEERYRFYSYGDAMLII